MRRTTHSFIALAATVAVVACQDDARDVVSPTRPSSNVIESSRPPLVRITSPDANTVVARGTGRVGAGQLTGGAAFTIILETVAGDANAIPANESVNIRNTTLLGQLNPNFPGLEVSVDVDMIAPDGTVIPRNTNLANLFNTLGTDDSQGKGVTVWAGWHVLESFPDGVESFVITATVRDADGRVGSDSRTVRLAQGAIAGQALTPAPSTFTAGDGVVDADGPVVSLIGPQRGSTIALGTPAVGAFTFFQVDVFDRSGAGIAVNENGDGITTPVGLIRDGGQLASAAANRNFPGFSFTFDVDFRTPNGTIVPAGRNLGPVFDIAGTALDNVSGNAITTTSWVVGGSFLLPAGRTSVTVRTSVTDNAGKTGSAQRTFDISTVADGQQLTPRP